MNQEQKLINLHWFIGVRGKYCYIVIESKYLTQYTATWRAKYLNCLSTDLSLSRLIKLILTCNSPRHQTKSEYYNCIPNESHLRTGGVEMFFLNSKQVHTSNHRGFILITPRPPSASGDGERRCRIGSQDQTSWSTRYIYALWTGRSPSTPFHR